jgi:cell division septum initiation protein DivIVA
MSEIALAKINTFGTSPKADFESPSEEAIFIKVCQLQEIITKALQPLQDEVSQLRATVERQDEKIASLEARIGLQEDNGLIQLRLIGQLREAAKKEVQPMQKDRGEILRALIAANGGKMLAKDARQKMHLTKQTFSMLIASMNEYIEIKPLHSDKRKDVLTLK